MILEKDLYQYTALPQQALYVWEQVGENLQNTLYRGEPKKRKAFFTVMGNSNFLARWVRRNPDLADSVFKINWEKTYHQKNFQEELASLMKNSSKKGPEEIHKTLSEFKYRHLFRITARDMGMKYPFAVIAAELSAMAKAILSWSLDWEKEKLEAQWGRPLFRKSKERAIDFSIIAMGKLGGRELNYSSDIDLIYFYETDKGIIEKEGKTSPISPHEFFCKLGERLSRLLGQKTSSGFLYRVDLELRPEGPSGPLANSLNAMEYYYENFGAFWEKQAMIKSDCAAGSMKAFQRFHQMIHPFVYPKTTDYSLLEKVRAMKQKVLQTVQKSSEKGYHVKLGEGGIREIEFFVQSLQILYGGQKPSLETTNTLEAIERLGHLKVISPQVENSLAQAYVFLRTLENRLQQVEEQQTHRLSDLEEERLQIARRMGYLEPESNKALEKFEKDLKMHCKFVKNTFEDLLEKRFKDL